VRHTDINLQKHICGGIPIELLTGVSLYSGYPFKLHDVYTLPWDICIENYKLWLTLTNCTGELVCDTCRPCCELLLNDIVSGIQNQIEEGIHNNTPLAFRSIEDLIHLIQQKTQTLDSLQFTKLAMVQKLLARAKTLDTYKKFVMALGDSKANISRITSPLLAAFTAFESVKSSESVKAFPL